MTLNRLTHPAIVCGGPQLTSVVEGMEAGTYPLPEDAVWREDLPHGLAVRLALATGATMEQVEEITGQPAVTEVPAPEPAQDDQPAAEDADAVIRHTHEDGTLVYGTSKGDGTAEILKAHRFRWFPSIKLWGIAQSRDHLAKRWQIQSAAEALRKAGFTVRVEIDDTPRDVTEVKADRAGRLDARYERLTAKAERSAAEGEARSARANQIAERFAGGQPILVGHHSERGARADQKRIDQNDQAAHEAFGKAERAAEAAAVVGKADAYRERPAVIIRRIAKTEAELRQTDHYINGTRPANDWRGAYGSDRKPASGDWLESLTARKTFLEHQIAADRAALAEHETSGYVLLTRDSVHVGDTVTSAHWWDKPAKVVRVNAKTVSVETEYTWTHKLPYEDIKSVQCPHEDTAVTVTAPKRPAARPKPAPVTVTRPPEREAPVTVDGSTEFFPTPAAVVERMIDAADLEADMTVLEPSAGLGAIASRVAPLVASVECIERNGQLASRLRAAAAWPGDVLCADFLEVPAAPAYDRVMMNPPFGRQADIRHVTHALGFVKPGGMVVAVMSAGVEFRQDKTTEAFRKLVADCGGWIERLPDDSFEASGTSVRTVMAVIPASAGTREEGAS